ncbi:hypothetical protein V8J88_00565 [Massilia sp. W12]|uniref:hypothetical protein n=1 Tax=Massilia sp. W12 TaxID=3126507 RepID=UPI0030D1D49E
MSAHLKTALIEGRQVPRFDRDITNNLLMEHTSLAEVRDEKMIIGIRNDSGEIYRLIGSMHLKNYMNAVEELFDMEMADELQDVEGQRHGCDAIFSQE